MTSKGATIDVGAWLRDLGLGQYETTFRENEIDADVLSDLTELDLEKIGLPLWSTQTSSQSDLKSDLPSNLRRIAEFYVPISKNREAEIRQKQRSRANASKAADIRLTSQEIVEDAGLNDDVVEPAQGRRKRSTGASLWA